MSDFHFGKMLGIEIQNGRGTEMQCSNANGVYSEFHVIKHELMHPNKEKKHAQTANENCIQTQSLI